MSPRRYRTTKATRRHALGPTHVRCTPIIELDEASDVILADDLRLETERGRALTGSDVDADRERAESSGEEAVGGSVPTPDQDVVDELAHALGVEQPDEEEFHSSGEILRERDRFRWHLERDAEDEAEGRPHHRRGAV